MNKALVKLLILFVGISILDWFIITSIPCDAQKNPLLFALQKLVGIFTPG